MDNKRLFPILFVFGVLLLLVVGVVTANADTEMPLVLSAQRVVSYGPAVVDGSYDGVQLRVQGHTTQTNNLAVFEDSNGVDKFTVNGDGAINFGFDVIIVTTDTVLTAPESGAQVVFKNTGTDKNTVSLPTASAGLNFCFTNYDGDDVEVDAAASDQIFHYTSAPDEEIDNTTAGDFICLVAIDGTDWVAVSIEGTWIDD